MSGPSPRTNQQMSRRAMLKASLAGAALVGTSRFATSAAAVSQFKRAPNILLLVTDDQRTDSLGCSGNALLKTPNIDALAANGVRFRNNFATTAICMSSRASVLTGTYTRTHGIDDFRKALAEPLFEQSYPKLLRKAGYITGFVGKWGIDGGDLPVNDYDFFRGYQGQGAYFSPDTGKHLTVVETEQAIEFLRGCSTQRPFCLAVSFKAPHVQDEGRFQPGIYPKYPYDRALEHLYENDVIPAVKTADVSPLPDFLTGSLNRMREAVDFRPATYQETMKDLYRLLSGVDLAVGKIVAELKSLGFDENTVVIYTADHGAFYGEHGFGGKWLMHEESIRTPMILCDPRLAAHVRGTTQDRMTLNLDVPSTVLELAGVAVPRSMQGASILPLARGETPAWRSEWFYENHFRNQKEGPIAASEGVRTSDWKYIRYIDTNPVYEQLFDLRNDPREERNLATEPAHAPRLEHLRQRWNTWRAALDEHTVDRPWVDPA